MMIKNFSQLAVSDLRKKALKIVENGMKAIFIKKIFQENIKIKNNFLFIRKEKIDLDKFNRIFIIGFGKGSSDAVLTMEKILKNKIDDGIVIDTSHKNINSRIKYLKGNHPIPSQKNIKATKKIINLLKNTKKDDLVIIVIFGGGSALLTYPVVNLDIVRKINKQLLKSGKNIYEINTVRKHLDRVKGGGLAKFAYPAKIYSLICSDVPGNDLSIIASGPAVKDKTSKNDAKKILREIYPNKSDFLKKYNIEKNLIETTKNEKYFKNVKNILIASNKVALQEMKKEAKKLGFKKVKIYSYKIQGEARETGKILLDKCKNKEVLLSGGETTVTVKGNGKGGRNQELVLGALEKISEKSLIISIASDGKDNTNAAGAIGDIHTKKKAEKMNLNPQNYLQNNNSYNFFKKTGDLIFSKRGANVADLMLIIKL